MDMPGREPGSDGASLAPARGPLGDVARPLAVFGRVLSTVAVLLMLAYAAAVVFVLTSGELDGEARQVEFVAFWSAGKLVLEGDAAGAFNQRVLRARQALPPDAEPGDLAWLYPPGLQFLFAPFALLPYWAAWLLFGILSLAVFARASWRLAGSVPMGRNLLIGAPAVLVVLQIGHIVLLWAAGLVAALRAMAAGRAAAAGLLLALLSLKPQLGILVPVALVAARRWDVLLWAAAGVVLVHGLPTLVVGTEYWVAFFAQMGRAARAVANDVMPHYLMASPYAFARYAGLAHEAALLFQGVLSLLLAGALYAVWSRLRSGEVDEDLAGGLLCTAVLLATPYAYFYELAILVPGAILLVRGGYGARTVDRVLLALALLGPAAFFVRTPLAPLFAPLLLLLFAHACRFALRGRAGALAG